MYGLLLKSHRDITIIHCFANQLWACLLEDKFPQRRKIDITLSRQFARISDLRGIDVLDIRITWWRRQFPRDWLFYHRGSFSRRRAMRIHRLLRHSAFRPLLGMKYLLLVSLDISRRGEKDQTTLPSARSHPYVARRNCCNLLNYQPRRHANSSARSYTHFYRAPSQKNKKSIIV